MIAEISVGALIRILIVEMTPALLLLETIAYHIESINLYKTLLVAYAGNRFFHIDSLAQHGFK